MIRFAHSGNDVCLVAGLYHRVWHETHALHMPCSEQLARDEAFFIDRLEKLMPNIIVAEVDCVVAGFAAWEGNLLGQLFLDVAHRGSGLAHDLIEAAECGLRDQGFFDAELHCLVGNERAKRFYERVGWRVTAVVPERVGSGADREERDFWMMRKTLSPNVR